MKKQSDVKAARIAELEREIAWEKKVALGSAKTAEWEGELARLRNKFPALIQGEGSEPVGWPEPLLTLDYVGGMIDELLMFGATDEDLRKLRARINKTLENAPASPPPLPAGNADPAIPQPRRRDGGEPCGECHLQAGETCDVCGARIR